MIEVIGWRELWEVEIRLEVFEESRECEVVKEDR